MSDRKIMFRDQYWILFSAMDGLGLVCVCVCGMGGGGGGYSISQISYIIILELFRILISKWIPSNGLQIGVHFGIHF